MSQRRPPIPFASGALPAAALAVALAVSGCNRTAPAPVTPNEIPSTAATSRPNGPTEKAAPDTADDYNGPVWFIDVTEAAGITFRHVSGTNEEKPFPAANGSGLAALDYDLDGRCDLYFATGTPFPLDAPCDRPVDQFYRNLGGMKFQEVGALCGLNYAGYSVGIAVGDYDSDGFSDVYVVCYGRNVLFRNNGDGTFDEIADAAQVDDVRWGTSAAMFDGDNDGLLDVYVCNYGKWTWETRKWCGNREKNVRVYCSPKSVEAEADKFFHNRGDGTFDDATSTAGLAQRTGRAQGVIAADLNGDGCSDLYIGNDLHANSLFLNTGDGRYEDVSDVSGTAYDFQGNMQAGMGVDAADVDGDGLPELFVTNFSNEHNAFYKNIGQGQFQEIAQQIGLYSEGYPWVGWGAAFADFDLDSWLDLVVVNGHVDDNRHLLGEDTPYRQPALLWKNVRGRFEMVRSEAGDYFRTGHAGRGLVVADLDNDGDQDIVAGHQDDRPAVLENQRLQNDRSAEQPRGAKGSITLRLIGVESNRDAIGASVTLHSPERSVVRQLKGGGSYLSSHQQTIVFAAPVGEDKLRFEVRWPRGKKSIIPELRAGNTYLVIEPAALDLSPRVEVLEIAR